jgi:hypothetical protein
VIEREGTPLPLFWLAMERELRLSLPWLPYAEREGSISSLSVSLR